MKLPRKFFSNFILVWSFVEANEILLRWIKNLSRKRKLSWAKMN